MIQSSRRKYKVFGKVICNQNVNKLPFNSLVQRWIPNSADMCQALLHTTMLSEEREEILSDATTKLKWTCDTNNLGNVHKLCILSSGSEGNRNRLHIALNNTNKKKERKHFSFSFFFLLRINKMYHQTLHSPQAYTTNPIYITYQQQQMMQQPQQLVQQQLVQQQQQQQNSAYPAPEKGNKMQLTK
jgi:hypothetical protein